MAAVLTSTKPTSEVEIKTHNKETKDYQKHGTNSAVGALKIPVNGTSSSVSPHGRKSPCNDKNCPKHGTNAAMDALKIPSNSTSASVSPHDKNSPCNHKSCPRHGQGVSGGTVKINVDEDAFNGKKKITGNFVSSKVQSNEAFNKDVDDLVEKAQQVLKISAPVPKAGGANNVLTFITNNHNHSTVSSADSTLSSLPTSPAVSPMKERLLSSSSAGMYDQMRMEHTLKENVVLHSISIKQADEILQLQNQLKETLEKLDKVKQEKDKLKAKVKDFVKVTNDWNNALKESEKTVKSLQSKLYYSDLRAKQLKRMASDNAATAAKWRSKVMESLEAQKELEEMKTASEKATLGMYQQFRDEKNKIVDLKQHHEVSLIDSDLDSTVSSAGILDTTVLQSPVSSTSGIL